MRKGVERGTILDFRILILDWKMKNDFGFWNFDFGFGPEKRI